MYRLSRESTISGVYFTSNRMMTLDFFVTLLIFLCAFSLHQVPIS